jgi:hypothetical protein
LIRPIRACGWNAWPSSNGQTVSALISRFAGSFATRLTTKLGAQAVPVLGAATGAAINYAFVDYYERVAQIHFRLLRLAEDHPDLDIDVEYADALRRAAVAPRGIADRIRRRSDQKGTSSPPPAG